MQFLFYNVCLLLGSTKVAEDEAIFCRVEEAHCICPVDGGSP
jgi:hypothetical protein